MKRRKAIGSILLAGGALAVGAGGYEWYSLKKLPDIHYLLSKKDLLAALADTIIPSTDTPGALEAGAVDYMLRFLTECTETKTLNRFISGLDSLESYTRSQFNRDYTLCNQEEKEKVLNYFEQMSDTTHSSLEKIKSRITGKAFFETLKYYTVHSYCISEKGASMGMHYIAVPGKFLSCIPLEPNQKAWATK